jgi:hypothetical protein
MKSFLKRFLAVGAVTAIAFGTLAYYPGDDGFDVPSYGAATLVNSLTIGGNAVITPTTAATDYVNINTTDNCTVGRININACVTNSVNPVVNVGGTVTGVSGQNYHVFSDSRDIELAAGTAANSYDARGTVTGNVTIDHFANFQAATYYNGTGTMTDLFGLYAIGTNLSTGTITNFYGVYVAGGSPGFGTVVNNYGLYVRDLGGTTGQYSVYSVGTDDTAYFAGKLGIGIEPEAGQRVVIRETDVLGGWLSGFWVRAASAPTIRIWETTNDKWAGLGSDNGTLHFLVGAAGRTGSPVDAGYVGATGGLVLGSATGGDKGLGTINVATNIYKNNTAYTNPDYVFEHYFNKGKIVKFAHKEGAKDYKGLKPLSEVRNFAEKTHALPRIQEARDRAAKQKRSTGLFDGGDALLASVEEAYLYLFKHDARITQLEQENLQLRKDVEALKKIVFKGSNAHGVIK